MPENLLTLLNYLLLGLLYLFFARVVWAVWSEIKAPKREREPARDPVAEVRAAGAAAPAVPAPASLTLAKPEKRRRRKEPSVAAGRLVVTQPPEQQGTTYELGPEITVGRAAGCQVALLSDHYASSLHARLYQADGFTMVEDLGSTNGTFVNGERITAPTAVRPGDLVQVGATVLEVE